MKLTRLTEAEKNFFESLINTNSGIVLDNYLKKIQDYICDSRNWQKEETKESANQAAQAIEKLLRVPLRTGGKQEEKVMNQSE